MDFDLTDDQKAFQQAAKQFAAAELAPHAARWDALSEFPLAVMGDGWHYAERIDFDPTIEASALLPDARDVLTIAMPKIENGVLMAIDEVQPLYLRDKVSWQKRKRLRENNSISGTGT